MEGRGGDKDGGETLERIGVESEAGEKEVQGGERGGERERERERVEWSGGEGHGEIGTGEGKV